MAGLWLKNLSIFTLTKFPEVDTEALNDALESHQFTPCASLERERHGFCPAFEQDSFVRKVEDVYLVQVKSEKKLLPGSVVNRMLAERIQEIQAREGRTVGKKEKRDLKDMIVDELLPKALAAQSVTTALIDRKAGYILVDTSSAKKAELVVQLLIDSIDDLEVSLVNFDNSIAKEITNLLLADEENPVDGDFTADSALVLKGPGSPAATVRFAQHNLQVPEVVAHLKAGLLPAAIELTFNDRVNFVLTDPFGVRKITYLDLVQEEIEGFDKENPDELIDAILALQAGELRELIKALMEWLETENG